MAKPKYVWLKANKKEGWKREIAELLGPSGNAIMVRVASAERNTNRYDDGLREITEDQIEGPAQLPLIIALMDSMWGDGGAAPRSFSINPYNFSGRRLYGMVGTARLLVTNCCPVMQTHANGHGKHDAAYVAENLRRLQPFKVLLVCGKPAQATYAASGYKPQPGTTVIEMPHPAARTWTKAALENMRRKIEKAARSVH